MWAECHLFVYIYFYIGKYCSTLEAWRVAWGPAGAISSINHSMSHFCSIPVEVMLETFFPRGSVRCKWFIFPSIQLHIELCPKFLANNLPKVINLMVDFIIVLSTGMRIGVWSSNLLSDAVGVVLKASVTQSAASRSNRSNDFLYDRGN